MRKMLLPALAAASLLALIMPTYASAQTPGLVTAKQIRVDLPDPAALMEVKYFQPVLVGPDTTLLRIQLPPAASDLQIGGLKYELSSYSPSTRQDAFASGSTVIAGGFLDIPVSAVMIPGVSNVSVSVNSEFKSDRLERTYLYTDAMQFNFNLRVDSSLSTPTAALDFTGPDRVYFSHVYNIGLPSGKPTQVQKGDTLVYTLPGTDSWKTGPYSASHRSKPRAFYGYQPQCGRAKPLGCGGGVAGTELPIKVSPDGKTAYVKLPQSLDTPAKHVPREIVWVSWWPTEKYLNLEGDLAVVQSVHVN